jgi:CO dehydrogenase/acetyl-CoA synthase epsilon subunit
MAKEIALLTLRIDVDYPYPSRIRSFISTAFGINFGGDYLRNSKIIARMINESPRDVKAYWFFTPKTVPDAELLKLIDNSRHEIALHIANNPYEELRLLEEKTGKKVNYYTVHGTERFFARLMWKRWKYKAPPIPKDFPLQSFYKFKALGLDIICYSYPTEQATKIAEKAFSSGLVLHVHPIWLFQRGKINYRGPFYETLRRILDVDKEFETLTLRRKMFFTIARDNNEYERDILPTNEFLEKLRQRGVDIFSFIERGWCSKLPNSPNYWIVGKDNIALLRVTSFEDWWKVIGKKTRNMIRKAEKSGIKVQIAQVDEKLAEGIWKIYNETPIRQERGFPHYGTSLDKVKNMVFSSRDSTFIGAYLQDELVGFIQLVHGEKIAVISQILSLQKHWDKAVNNALIAKTVEFCAQEGVPWIMYGRMGNHPSLDRFKQNNGFTQFQLNRYYIPLTRKGRIAVKLGLHREVKDMLPQKVKYPLIPIYNWVSRTKMKMKVHLKL